MFFVKCFVVFHLLMFFNNYVYINDIVETLFSIVRLFADDTSLVCSSASIRDTEGILNYD